MFSPPKVTARISGLSRAPPQVLHGMTAMYSSSLSLTFSHSDSSYRRMTLDKRALVARVPVRLAPVAREVVDADALVAEPVQERRRATSLGRSRHGTSALETPRCLAAAATSCG